MQFCHDPIWDTDPVWHALKPQFCHCFLRTLPAWIPSAFLCLCSLIQFYILFTKRRNSPKFTRKSFSLNYYNVSRFMVALAIVLVNAAQLGYDSYYAGRQNDLNQPQVTWSVILYSIVQVLTFIIYAILLNVHRLSGVHTSGISWFFVTGSIILSLPNLYSFCSFNRKDSFFTTSSLITFSIHFAGLLALFVLNCFSDSESDSNGEFTINSSIQRESPDRKAPFSALLTFSWFDSFTWKGFRKTFVHNDMWPLNSENTTDEVSSHYDRNWHRSRSSNAFLTILLTYKWSFAAGAFLELCTALIKFASPQLLKVFLGFISTPNSTEPMWHGFFLAVSFFLVATLQSFFSNHYLVLAHKIGMRMRTALISAIYRKSLKLSNSARNGVDTGEIVNLMSVDVQHMSSVMYFIHNIWSHPLQIAIALFFLYRELGASVFAGLGVLLIMIPLNGTISGFQGSLQKTQMEHKDERIKVTNEILNGIRVIKLYGWEIPFIDKVSAIRRLEVRQLAKIAYLNVGAYVLWTAAPYLVVLVTFAVYVLSSPDNILDAQKAFVSLSLFDLLRLPLGMLPNIIVQMVMAVVSLKRINKLLNAQELEPYVTRNKSTNAISIENGNFSWDPTSEQPTLKSINIHVPKGSLVAVVGRVGSGKSSLISAMLGNIDRQSGGVNVANSCSVAYVPQQAWIRNYSLRENILFGNAFNQSRYDSAIEMCALKPDLAILPAGDSTEIGERGINLSGGQKQRVALARACYAEADIVLLDDPLSAVDAHVAKHIFKHVLSNQTGFLRGRTRVLATNSLSILPEVDRIILLTDGAISEVGSYQDLMLSNGRFAELVREHMSEHQSDNVSMKEESINKLERSSSILSNRSSIRKRTFTKQSIEEYDLNAALEPTEEEEEESGGKQLIKKEHVESGQVKITNYLTYFRSFTWLYCFLILLGYVSKQCASVGSSVWLAIWSNDAVPGSVGNDTVVPDVALRNTRLGVYAALGAAQAICHVVGSIGIARGSILSARFFHRRLLHRIMRAQAHFFDTTPLGRIVNRFSKDMDSIDTTIPFSLEGLVFCLLEVVSTLIFIAVRVPIFLAVAVPALILYYLIQKFYLATSRQLKRLDSVTRSPIYSHFGETLSGVSTIRAYGRTDDFIQESNSRVDSNQRCVYPSIIANQWLALRLEFCGNLIVLFAALFAVLSKSTFEQQAGFVGLIMTYSFSVTANLNWMVRMTSEMENSVVSVERIDEYSGTSVPTENEWTRERNTNPAIPTNWPAKGEICFENYAVRYREGLDLVLQEVSLDIKFGEKIGIVGRTGSGKSTLTLALFRILEATAGRIVIDGVEVGKIGLHELRSILSIIPQDPVLFSGTIRSNLDPNNLYTDDQLWEALAQCHLKPYIASLEAGLDSQVAEHGSNLSIGQRQLLCLGRALLRKTRILVLDEATAAIDLETDALIQQTIRREFAHCTVLTIAHRLNTILDSTRVLVMEQGRVAEFESPEILLQDRNSRFYGLAKDAGIVGKE